MCANTLSNLLFFFNDTATTEIYSLSLHDALPISVESRVVRPVLALIVAVARLVLEELHLDPLQAGAAGGRSEEHTSELQSHSDLVCRLLLEKKKKKIGVEQSAEH